MLAKLQLLLCLSDLKDEDCVRLVDHSLFGSFKELYGLLEIFKELIKEPYLGILSRH